MKERFVGDEAAHRRLITSLAAQQCVGGSQGIAATLAAAVAGSIRELKKDEELIRQDQADNNLFFILAGSVSILVNGREIAARKAGQHVGEMALIDPSAKRSASVMASEDGTVIAEVTEAKFVNIANEHPALWRALAVELGHRLRERSKYVHAPNPQPIVFVGSSREGLEPARAIQMAFQHEKFITKVWTDGIFNASKATIEDLATAVTHADFAVLVFTADDLISSRGADAYAPRDNVIFELGLFMGALGRERSFIVRPRGVALKIPSDLLGIS
jgi:CRP/FNR family transcriptional regulator, cyclic AMP receptor protein